PQLYTLPLHDALPISIEEEYLKASILVHPAKHEGWGLAASEGLAAGIPVIGFADCPGINRLVRHGTNGLLVPADADCVPALAEADRKSTRLNSSHVKI